MSAMRRASLTGRRALAVVVGLAIVAGLIIVFSGTLTRSTDIEARAEQVRAEVAALEQELAEREDEQALFESDDFIRWQARVHGLGRPGQGERLFVLPQSAPSPEPITPIGPQEASKAMAPFDAWMELLFGA